MKTQFSITLGSRKNGDLIPHWVPSVLQTLNKHMDWIQFTFQNHSPHPELLG